MAKTIKWLSFPDQSARLIVIIPLDKKPVIALRINPGLAGEAAMAAAERAGFLRKPEASVAYYPRSKDGKTLTTTELAGFFEAAGVSIETINLSSEAFAEKPWRWNAASQRPVQPLAPQEPLEEIGMNFRGELVLRSSAGRFYRVVDDNGGRQFVEETAKDRPALFLRAVTRQDVPLIAQGLMKSLEKVAINAETLTRFRDLMMEAGPAGATKLEPNEARELLASELVVQIGKSIRPDRDIRKTFDNSCRLAERVRHSGIFGLTDKGFIPSPAIATALQRSLGNLDGLRHDIQGSADLRSMLSLSSRSGADKGADVQVIDLTLTGHEHLSEVVMNSLARRVGPGRSYFVLKGTPDDLAIDRLRDEVGRRYALESVATIDPQIHSASIEGETVTIIGVGMQRHEMVDALPEAARRVTHVQSFAELWNWSSEVLRSRGRIAEFAQAERNALVDEVEAEREANARQVPYQALSQVKQPFTMIPMALEAATMKALRRVQADLEHLGGVDAVVAADLGLEPARLGDILNSEQVDALGLHISAQARDRGFLDSDQTGVGKGRTLAAIGRRHLRRAPGVNKLIYFTESANINIPDVWRDLMAVGADREIRPYLLATDAEIFNRQGELVAKASSSAARKALIQSGEFPADCNAVLTTYSQFSKPEGSEWHHWLRDVIDENTMIILDEAHNALSPDSNMGVGIRVALEAAFPGNVIFGTATPLRDPRGADLYAPLLPADVNREDILGHLAAGKEIAQETFTTMLAEDGVMIRRDHDLSNIEFEIRYPSNERVQINRQYMDLLAPVVEAMLGASFEVSRQMGAVQNDAVRRLLARGADLAVATARVNQMHQYSLGFGSPLLNLTRIYMNALKVEQVAQEALNELAEGRKPMITLHSTNTALLQESIRNENGDIMTAEEIAALPPLSLRDQVTRIAARIFRVTRDGLEQDARDLWPDVAERAREIETLIARLPTELPVSPIDALIERLEVEGLRVGELTGRTLAYRDGQIVRRTDTDRRDTINRYNGGEIDCLIFNAAGATGGSYHAAPEFADQRPRSNIEMETPPDIIKYIQGQGRSNRLGQVARPRVVSVVTGLAPEMRILAQRNRKLRLLGASVDGNRSHPLLMDNVPDLINQVGDMAAERVLRADPVLARRMGFEDLVEGLGEDVQGDVDSTTAEVHSLANKVLARSILLAPDVQQDLFERVTLEFDAIVEELDSRNANPLRPKMLKGEIRVLATSLYEGQERLETDLESSAFTKPLYMSTAEHVFSDTAMSGERIRDLIDRAITDTGVDGFQRYADALTQSKPNFLQAFLSDGITYEQAMANPGLKTRTFASTEARLDRLIWLLENMKPGVQMTFPDGERNMFERRTIVKLHAPMRSHIHMASAYKVHLIAPGDHEAQIVSLTRFLGMRDEDLRFMPGFSQGFDDQMLLEFEESSRFTRRLPVQILTGNHLLAMAAARNHNLGAMSLYRSENGMERGVVVNPSKINLRHLPCVLPNPETATRFLLSDPTGMHLSAFYGMNKDLSYMVHMRRAVGNRIKFKVKPYNVSGSEFWSSKPLLWQIATGTPLPAEPVRNATKLIEHSVDINDGGAALLAALREAQLPLQTEGENRDRVNELSGAVLAAALAADEEALANPEIVQTAPAVETVPLAIVPDVEPVATPAPAPVVEDDFDGPWASNF